MSKRKTRATVATEASETHFAPGSDIPDHPTYEAVVTSAEGTTRHPITEEQATSITAALSPPKPARSRRVSAEAVKAETRLLNIERASKASIAACVASWTAKRTAFIASLPHDVQGMLLAGGVITDDDLEGLPQRD